MANPSNGNNGVRDSEEYERRSRFYAALLGIEIVPDSENEDPNAVSLDSYRGMHRKYRNLFISLIARMRNDGLGESLMNDTFALYYEFEEKYRLAILLYDGSIENKYVEELNRWNALMVVAASFIRDIVKYEGSAGLILLMVAFKF